MKKICSRNVALVLLTAMLALVAACGSDSSTGVATGSVTGTITFRNTWPSTGAIYLTVFAEYPPTGAPDAFTNPITQAMLGPGRTFKYKIPALQTGTYKSVFIGWRGGVGNDKCLGLYWAFPDSVGIGANCVAQDPGPLSITVKKNTATANINMIADLSLAQ
jgi:hypothetical protein